MKLQDVIPQQKYGHKKDPLKPHKGSWFSYTKYRSANAMNGGVTRWSYASGKEARNTY